VDEAVPEDEARDEDDEELERTSTSGWLLLLLVDIAEICGTRREL